MRKEKRAPRRTPVSVATGPEPLENPVLDAEVGEALVEARHLAAAVDDPVLTGPGRMGLRIDLEPQNVTRVAPGRLGLVFGAVGHHDSDFVIIGMDISLHFSYSCPRAFMGAGINPDQERDDI